MALAPSRCAVCNQQAYRDRYGRMMMHTRPVVAGYGLPPVATVCEGWDRNAQP